jgi:hypothetical protein
MAERTLLTTEEEDSGPLRLPLVPIAVLVLLAVSLYSGWRYYTLHGWPNLRFVRAAGRPSPPPAPRPAPPASPSPPTALPAPTPAPATEGFVVRVKAKEDTWVEIRADERLVMSAILPAGSEKSVHAQRSIVLKTGNAAGIELYHNDKLVPPLGATKEVKTVEFTAAGLRQ